MPAPTEPVISVEDGIADLSAELFHNAGQPIVITRPFAEMVLSHLRVLATPEYRNSSGAARDYAELHITRELVAGEEPRQWALRLTALDAAEKAVKRTALAFGRTLIQGGPGDE
jgi:hypothetical protein